MSTLSTRDQRAPGPCATCPHVPRELSAAVGTVCTRLDIPDCLTRAGLKRANRDLDGIFERLGKLIRTDGGASGNGNVELAACAVVLNRLCCDDKLLRRLIRDYDLLFNVSLLLKVPCELCTVASLHLAISISQSFVKDPIVMERIGIALLPAVVEAVKGREKDDIYAECAGMFFVNYLMTMLCVEAEDQRRALLKAFLHYTALVGRCSAGLLSYLVFFWTMAAIEGPMFLEDWGRPFYDFFIGILRVGGPLNRLYALKGVYLHRRAGRPNIAYTDLSHGVPFNLDIVITNAQRRLNIQTENFDPPDVQALMFAQTVNYTAVQKFYTSAERDVGQVAVCIALMLLEDPLSFSLDGNIPVRYGLPDGPPRRYGMPINDWKDILKYCAEVISKMTPRAIKVASDACRMPPPASFSASRQDLAEVLLTADWLLRNDFTNSSRMAFAAFSRTREMRCKAWFIYVLSWSTIGYDVDLVFETIKAWFRGQADAEILASAACLMTLRNLAVHSLEWALCGMKEHDARSPTGLSVRTKNIITSRGMADMYLKICTKDARDGQTMVAVHILTKLLFDGPTLGPGFLDSEMQELIDLYENHTRSARVNWCDARRSHLVPAVEMFLKHRVSGWRMFSAPGLKFHERLPWPIWGELPECHNCFDRVPARTAARLVTQLHERPSQRTSWAELPTDVFTTVVTGHPNELSLYRCETCNAHSASLRRCSGCRNLRYCGRECQKSHWRSGHRDECTYAFI